MRHSINFFITFFLLHVGGCSVATSQPNVSEQGTQKSAMKDAPKGINGVTAESLEGKKYKIFLGSAYLGVRNQLKDGEILTLNSVDFVPSLNGRGYFKAHFLDSKGVRIFPKKYSLSDVGVLDSRIMSIDTSVSMEKVNQGRGELIHGKTPAQLGESYAYLYASTSNGDSVRAHPVSLNDYGDKNPKNLQIGLSFSCSKGKLYGVADFQETFIATNEGANLKFSFPNLVNVTLRGVAIDYNSVFFEVTSNLESSLINSEAGELVAYPDANGVSRISWRNNGLSEAYTRVKRNCK